MCLGSSVKRSVMPNLNLTSVHQRKPPRDFSVVMKQSCKVILEIASLHGAQPRCRCIVVCIANDVILAGSRARRVRYRVVSSPSSSHSRPASTTCVEVGYRWCRHECMVCKCLQRPVEIRLTVLPRRMLGDAGVASCPDSAFRPRKTSMSGQIASFYCPKAPHRLG